MALFILDHVLTDQHSWALDKPNAPVFGRQGLSHTIIDNNTFSSSKSFDDAVSFNTQSGSQWDGLRHVINAEAGALYNGVSKGEVNGPEATGVLGIDSELGLLVYPFTKMLSSHRVA